MIKLKKIEIPLSLQEHKDQWTKELMDYVDRGEKVPDNIKNKYNQADVKEQLRTETNGKCMYCGKILNGIGGNPNDYGLHSEYVDFSDKGVCPRCDELVTQTNRCIRDILNHDGNPEPYFSTLMKHIGDVSDHYDELKNRKSYFPDK